MANVKVILREVIDGVGDAGEVVSVKPGFARNYLLRLGKATLATEAKVNELEHHQRVIAEKVARELKDLRAAAAKLSAVKLEVKVQVGEEGKLFGSVTSAQIGELLAAKGFEIDKRKISLADPIKEAGEHQVPIKLHKDVVANVTVLVAAAE
jgi:large subunit ribosomal protein L9